MIYWVTTNLQIYCVLYGLISDIPYAWLMWNVKISAKLASFCNVCWNPNLNQNPMLGLAQFRSEKGQKVCGSERPQAPFCRWTKHWAALWQDSSWICSAEGGGDIDMNCKADHDVDRSNSDESRWHKKGDNLRCRMAVAGVCCRKLLNILVPAAAADAQNHRTPLMHCAPICHKTIGTDLTKKISVTEIIQKNGAFIKLCFLQPMTCKKLMPYRILLSTLQFFALSKSYPFLKVTKIHTV